MAYRELPPEEAMTALLAVDPAKIKSAYSGTPGCACGCQGTHYARNESPAADAQIARIFTSLKNSDTVECLDCNDGELVFSVETATRLRILYVEC